MIKKFKEFTKNLNENNQTQIKYDKLIDLAKNFDYNTFLDKTDSLTTIYDILYRGMSEYDILANNSFMTDWVGHARQYSDYVDGIVVDDFKDVMYFDNKTFNKLRDGDFAELLIPNIPRNFDYDDYEKQFKKALKIIYDPYFKEDKLSDAMYGLNYNEKKIINFVYDFIVNSTEDYKKYSMNKQNDFFIPLLTYYAKSKGKNIISFYGSDYGGSDEFVVNDISRYIKLSDIWKSQNK